MTADGGSGRDIQIEIACDHADEIGNFFQRFDIEGIRIEHVRLELRDDLPVLHVAAFLAVEKVLQGNEIPVGCHRQFLAVCDDFGQKIVQDGGEDFPVVFQKRCDPFGFFDFQNDQKCRDTLFGRFSGQNIERDGAFDFGKRQGNERGPCRHQFDEPFPFGGAGIGTVPGKHVADERADMGQMGRIVGGEPRQRQEKVDEPVKTGTGIRVRSVNVSDGFMKLDAVDGQYENQVRHVEIMPDPLQKTDRERRTAPVEFVDDDHDGFRSRKRSGQGWF